MSLGLKTEAGEGGDFNAVLKFDARAGRFYRVDRTERDGSWETDNVEVTDGFQGIFDLENIEVGWINFSAGQAPEWKMVKLGAELPARPSDKFKQGFRLMLKLGKQSGGDVREFASCAKVVINAIDKIHTEYEAGKATNVGKLPLIVMTGSTMVKSGSGTKTSTNYGPNLSISKWLTRPVELGGEAKAGAPASPPPPPPPPADDDGSEEF